MGGIVYYGKYTKDQVERANQIDLEELLRRICGNEIIE